MDLMGSSLQGAYTNQVDYDQKSVGRAQPVRDQIQREVDMHKQELKRLDAMLKLIEENPAIEQFINLQRGYIG
jgi:hypothetical protein